MLFGVDVSKTSTALLCCQAGWAPRRVSAGGAGDLTGSAVGDAPLTHVLPAEMPCWRMFGRQAWIKDDCKLCLLTDSFYCNISSPFQVAVTQQKTPCNKLQRMLPSLRSLPSLRHWTSVFCAAPRDGADPVVPNVTAVPQCSRTDAAWQSCFPNLCICGKLRLTL